jgi:hypothetical protein
MTHQSGNLTTQGPSAMLSAPRSERRLRTRPQRNTQNIRTLPELPLATAALARTPQSVISAFQFAIAGLCYRSADCAPIPGGLPLH